jgi:hypothetical protein
VFPEISLKVKSQGETNACSGFALSLVAWNASSGGPARRSGER